MKILINLTPLATSVQGVSRVVSQLLLHAKLKFKWEVEGFSSKPIRWENYFSFIGEEKFFIDGFRKSVNIIPDTDLHNWLTNFHKKYPSTVILLTDRGQQIPDEIPHFQIIHDFIHDYTRSFRYLFHWPPYLGMYSMDQFHSFLSRKQEIKKRSIFLCPSNWTINHFQSLYDVDSKQIELTPWGVDHILEDSEYYEQNSILKGLDKAEDDSLPSFLFFYGGLGYRKNWRFLVRLYKRLPKEIQEKIPFFLIGINLPNFPTWKKYIKGGGIFTTPILSDREIHNLCQANGIFLFPSLAEGFGFPPLEAKAWGAKTFVSQLTALYDWKEYFDYSATPFNEQLWKNVLIELLTNKNPRCGIEGSSEKVRNHFRWEKVLKKISKRANTLL